MTKWAKVTSDVIDNGFGESRYGNEICGIIIHHAASTNALAYVAGWNARSSHPSYHIASSGAVTGIVNVNKRPFSTAHAVDQQAITVEIDNSSMGGNWPVSDSALDSLVAIIVDHCKQRGYKNAARSTRGHVQKEFFVGWHSQYTATACPGPFIMANLDDIISAVNKELNPPKPKPKPKPEPKPEPVNTDDVLPPKPEPEPKPDPEPEPTQPEPAEPEPTEDTPMTNPNLDNLGDTLDTVADESKKYLPAKTRKKIYKTVTIVNSILASVGAVGLSTSALIGGEIGATFAAVSATILVISTAIGGASARIASKNMT